MEGFFRDKYLPEDMKVNESSAQCLVRKLSELQSRNTDMAVQLADTESKCRELTVEDSGLKAMFNKPQAYLSWYAIPSTREKPLPCGEYFNVHDETGHKDSDGTDYWPMFAKPKIETPATDASLVEVWAQGVGMFALMLAEEAIKDNNITTGWKARASRAAPEYAELLCGETDK